MLDFPVLTKYFAVCDAAKERHCQTPVMLAYIDAHRAELEKEVRLLGYLGIKI